MIGYVLLAALAVVVAALFALFAYSAAGPGGPRVIYKDGAAPAGRTVRAARGLARLWPVPVLFVTIASATVALDTGYDSMTPRHYAALAVAVAGGLAIAVAYLRDRKTLVRSVATSDFDTDLSRVGADRMLAGCLLVAGPVPDPGHPGGMPLALWQPPARYGPVLVLEAFNGTKDPATGRYERLAHRVSDHHTDPVAAAAASYGLPADQYAQLAART